MTSCGPDVTDSKLYKLRKGEMLVHGGYNPHEVRVREGGIPVHGFFFSFLFFTFFLRSFPCPNTSSVFVTFARRGAA